MMQGIRQAYRRTDWWSGIDVYRKDKPLVHRVVRLRGKAALRKELDADSREDSMAEEPSPMAVPV